MLPALLLGGFGAWLSFGYLAARHRRLPWLAAAVAYAVLAVTGLALVGNGPDSGDGQMRVDEIVGVSLLVVLWPAGIIHALWVHFALRPGQPLEPGSSGEVDREGFQAVDEAAGAPAQR
jgi:hypothetical protein